MVNARLSKIWQMCKTYLDEYADADRRANGRAARDQAICQTLSRSIEHLKMSLSVFPIDGLIPTLVDATDPRRSPIFWRKPCQRSYQANSSSKMCISSLAHYGRYKRCVLRYSVDGIQTADANPSEVNRVRKSRRGWIRRL